MPDATPIPPPTLCRQCAYSLRSTPPNALCPECGITILPADPDLIPWLDRPRTLQALKLSSMFLQFGLGLMLLIHIYYVLFGYPPLHTLFAVWRYSATVYGPEILLAIGVWELAAWRIANRKNPSPTKAVWFWRIVLLVSISTPWITSIAFYLLRNFPGVLDFSLIAAIEQPIILSRDLLQLIVTLFALTQIRIFMEQMKRPRWVVYVWVTVGVVLVRAFIVAMTNFPRTLWDNPFRSMRSWPYFVSNSHYVLTDALTICAVGFGIAVNRLVKRVKHEP